MKKKTAKSAFFNAARPTIFGHKGSGGDAPENTFPSFDKAIKDGADVLETDLRLTKDGVVVIMHDAFLEGTTNGTGWVRDYTLEELKKLDAAYNFSTDGGKTFPLRGTGITIPTLDELFARYPGVKINLDMKTRNPAIVGKVLDLIEKHSRADITMAGSFHYPNARRIRHQAKKRGLAIKAYAAKPEVAAAVGATKLHNPFHTNKFDAFDIPVTNGKVTIITEEFVKRAHANGRKVAAWTINDPAEMKRLLEMGIDGIITDYPARAAKVIREFQNGRK